MTYYRTLKQTLAVPTQIIDNDLRKRETASISEKEDELIKRLQRHPNEIMFGYGMMLDEKLDKFSKNIMDKIDNKLELLETSIKLDAMKESKINDSENDS